MDNSIKLSDNFLINFNQGVKNKHNVTEDIVKNFYKSQKNNPDRNISYNLLLLLDLYINDPISNPIFYNSKMISTDSYKEIKQYAVTKYLGIDFGWDYDDESTKRIESMLSLVMNSFESYFKMMIEYEGDINFIVAC